MKIVVVGHGGHSKVISDLILQSGYEIHAYLDEKYREPIVKKNIIYGPINWANKLIEDDFDIKFIIAIGNNKIRKQVVQILHLTEDYYVTLIHQSAIVSPTSCIGAGTVVMPNAVINADSKIGQHTIINSGSIVEHDCQIGDFTHLSPRAVLTGAVQVNEGVSIGAGATVIPNIKIGEWAIVGAGATVIHDLPSKCTAVGVPAKIKSDSKDGGEEFVKYCI
ncbi:acetyltransferase [Bacillus sp. JJ1764]|uniref:acetyltransferase n=1 Tax=Bacillus sp. JJ1764 TaxID=3122964 RepID=UPI0030008F2A